ncbi:MAG TPA: hypothetical protein VGR71_06170 [Nitrospira sp.]|nr:hypothetical protein [Nitrospira sp.]
MAAPVPDFMREASALLAEWPRIRYPDDAAAWAEKAEPIIRVLIEYAQELEKWLEADIEWKR